jgi:hypothetical protein
MEGHPVTGRHPAGRLGAVPNKVKTKGGEPCQQFG